MLLIVINAGYKGGDTATEIYLTRVHKTWKKIQ